MFIREEHAFLESLVKIFTIQLIDFDHVNSKEIVDALNRSLKYTNETINIIKRHESELKIMVDGIDQPIEEKAYKKEHRELIIAINDFLKNYRVL